MRARLVALSRESLWRRCTVIMGYSCLFCSALWAPAHGSCVTARLNATEPHAPLGGIANGCWRLVFNDTESEYQKALEEAHKFAELSYSLGFRLAEEGAISDIVPGTPAYVAGLGPGMKI